jgi:hypothetical protein
MGKLLFVNTSRANGIFAVVVCAGAIVAGVWLGVEGTYIGLLLVPAGLVGGKFFLKLATMRSELYEQGFITKNCFGSVTARYADLKSISRFAVRRSGVLNTHIYFVTQSGEMATIIDETIRQDNKMTQLLDQACESLASTWMKNLDRQNEVVWTMKGKNPNLRIRKDGVIYQGKNGADEFIPLNELQLKPGFAGAIEICRGDVKVVKANSAEANYFTGETLLSMLARQRGPVVMPSADPENRAMAARATNSMA